MSKSQMVKKEEQSALIKKANDKSTELNTRYPIPKLPHRPVTGWTVVDLVAFDASPPEQPVMRTFQARDLINDDIPVRSPELRTQSFFTEVRKLLVFTRDMRLYESIWDDEVLNERALDIQDAKVMAFIDGDPVWDGTQREVLDYGRVTEVFEMATDMEVDNLTFYVEWQSPSLAQEFSLVKEKVRQRIRSATSRKSWRRKT